MSTPSWDPPEPQRQWHLSMWTQRTPVPMLERRILEGFAAGLKRSLEEAGSGFRQDSVCFVNGYCYMATSALSEEEIAARRQRHVDHCIQLEAQGTDVYEAEVRPMLEARLADLRRRRRTARDRTALVAVLTEAIDAATDAMGNWHWRMWPSPFDWKATFVEVTARPEPEASVLLQGVGHMTSKLVGRLQALGRQVRVDPKLLDVVARGDTGALGDFPAFEQAFTKLLREHGRRTGYGLGSNVNFHTPTWSMRPEMVLQLIAGYARSDLDAVEASEQRAKRQRTAVARRIRAALASEPERLARFDAAYARAIDDVRRGENSNHLIEQETMGAMRESIDAVGQFFVRLGALDVADDAYQLTLDELRSHEPDGLRALVVSRKAELDRLAELEPPAAIGAVAGGPPGRASHPPAPADAAKGADAPGNVLIGVAVARGRTRGRARVVASTAEPPDVEPGDVLVASDAGPAWTPVFPIVGALVLDGGHVADHAAIMCRDLGIPAVMRTTDATTRIVDGTTVVVDGDAGTVTLEQHS